MNVSRLSPTASAYVKGLIGKVFKILPMREDSDRGAINFLDSYLASLYMEMKGSMKTFPELAECKEYVCAVNTVAALDDSGQSFKTFRSETLKTLSILQKLSGGGS